MGLYCRKRRKKGENKEMNSDRIKELQKRTAHPESRSVTLALTQVWNECAQENNKQINEMREIMGAAASMAGKDWIHVQIALVEYLTSGHGENLKWLLSEYANLKDLKNEKAKATTD